MQWTPLKDRQAENLVHFSTVNYGGGTATTSSRIMDIDFVPDIVPTGSPLGNSLVWTFSEWRMVNLH